jgi:hypothetical protein
MIIYVDFSAPTIAMIIQVISEAPKKALEHRSVVNYFYQSKIFCKLLTRHA